MKRRQFLKTTAVAVVATTGGTISCGGSRSPWRFFTRQEASTLSCVCEQLIPTDQDPGASWTGAVDFIDRQLGRAYKRYQETYKQGLQGVDQASTAVFGRRFTELADAEQVKVLTALEKGEAPGDIWKQLPQKEFFNLVLAHTMQSYYGDPRHGGNRDAVSWRMLGVPNPPLRGRQKYDLTQAAASVSS